MLKFELRIYRKQVLVTVIKRSLLIKILDFELVLSAKMHISKNIVPKLLPLKGNVKKGKVKGDHVIVNPLVCH